MNKVGLSTGGYFFFIFLRKEEKRNKFWEAMGQVTSSKELWVCFLGGLLEFLEQCMPWVYRLLSLIIRYGIGGHFIYSDFGMSILTGYAICLYNVK